MAEFEKIGRIRNQIMGHLEKERPNIAKVVSIGNYLVTRVKIRLTTKVMRNGKIEENKYSGLATIIDFTSKHIEHLHDFKEYTGRIQKNFFQEGFERVH